MKIEIVNSKIINIDVPVIVLPVFEDGKMYDQVAEIDKKVDGLISSIIKEGYFTPTLGQVHVLYTFEKIRSKKIVLVGLGKKGKIDNEKLYKAFAAAISYIGKTKIKQCGIYIDKQNEQILQNIIETSLLSLYKFHHHKTKQEETQLKKIYFVVKNNYSKDKMQEISNKAKIIVDAIYCARDLVNHPSNYITPTKLAHETKEILEGKDTKITILGEREMAELGMGLLLSVSRGSDEEAKLIVIDYKPEKYSQTLALVGKGLTFDSGGLSLKPSSPIDHMLGMNMDMGGAASVIGAIKALKMMNIKNIRIVGVIPATENMISGKAQKPGDVWRSLNGKTVEVLNTDAEGRLVLADAITYVQKNYKPNYLIDLATLTGACVVALGHEYTGLFSNDTVFANKFITNSVNSYEKVWRLPVEQMHHEEIKSDVADIKNLGNGGAGASSAAAFLEEFIEPSVKWAHLDIAGTASLDHALRAYEIKGGTGAGVKTLVELVEKF